MSLPDNHDMRSSAISTFYRCKYNVEELEQKVESLENEIDRENIDSELDDINSTLDAIEEDDGDD